MAGKVKVKQACFRTEVVEVEVVQGRREADLLSYVTVRVCSLYWVAIPKRGRANGKRCSSRAGSSRKTADPEGRTAVMEC